jgi:hypothetical protein
MDRQGCTAGACDLTTDRRSCRLDRLVAVATTDRTMATANADITEYRLVMTATPPTDPRVQRLLLPADETAPVHPGWHTHRYRIDANAVWPPGQGQPPREWSFLRSAVAREELTRFAAEFVLELGGPMMSGDLTDPGPRSRCCLAMWCAVRLPAGSGSNAGGGMGVSMWPPDPAGSRWPAAQPMRLRCQCRI